MNRRSTNPVSKQELRIRRQVSEIEAYAKNREECPEFIRDQQYPLTYLEKYSKKFPEATERVARTRLILRGKTIDEVMEEDALNGNYPMTKERLLELIEMIPEELMIPEGEGFPSVKVKDWLKVMVMGEMMTDVQMYGLYLKEVKQYLTK